MLSTFLVILYFGLFYSNGELSVTVPDLKNTEAPIYMAIYKDNEDFLNTKKMFTGAKAEPKGNKSAELKVELPEGEYALAIFQDINGNGELDTNILGIPKEPYGFSKNYKPVFSAPKFRDCSIEVKQDTKVSIRLLD